MRAMTWWDHETDSIWSQPWGMAISGQLEGTELELIPAGIVPWGTWLADHPDSLVLKVAVTGLFGAPFRNAFVIGVTLGEQAKAYPFQLASNDRIINDRIGTDPVLVLADPDTKAINIYNRNLGGRDLEFILREDRLTDTETQSTWNQATGNATQGPLRGEVLRRVPYITSFDWAWEDFYPHSDFYGAEG